MAQAAARGDGPSLRVTTYGGERGRPASPARTAEELRGRQLLLYAPAGPIGGSFICSRCGALAFQPDLIGHRPGCLYLAGTAPRVEN